MNKLILSLLFFTLIFSRSSAFADIEQSFWEAKAKNICEQITKAVTYYQAGDLQNATKQAILAYFKGYDAEIEPAARVTLGASHVFEVEHEFRAFKTAMTPSPTKTEFKAVEARAKSLCQAVYQDAKALEAAHIDHEVFKVE